MCTSAWSGLLVDDSLVAQLSTGIGPDRHEEDVEHPQFGMLERIGGLGSGLSRGPTNVSENGSGACSIRAAGRRYRSYGPTPRLLFPSLGCQNGLPRG